MAANLVSVVMQFLTPDMIAKFASALGIDRSVAQKAIGGAVPALLASLAGVASTPQGASQLSNTLAKTGALVEWAPGAGRVSRVGLTGWPGFWRKAHAETPIPQR
jgi:hypothetical protein